jgi:hypothetical protein
MSIHSRERIEEGDMLIREGGEKWIEGVGDGMGAERRGGMRSWRDVKSG